MTQPKASDVSMTDYRKNLELVWKHNMAPAMKSFVARNFPCGYIVAAQAPFMPKDKGIVLVKLDDKYYQMPNAADDVGKSEACSRCANQLRCLTPGANTDKLFPLFPAK